MVIYSFSYFLIYNDEFSPCSYSEAVIQQTRSNRHSRSDSEAVFHNRKLPKSGEGEADVVGLKASQECARAIDSSRDRIRSGCISRQPEDGLRETFELLTRREMDDRQLDFRNLHWDSAIRGGDDITNLLRSRNSCPALHPILRTGRDTTAYNRQQCGQQKYYDRYAPFHFFALRARLIFIPKGND